ncbi:hypothetical protein SELMODRAFT_128086 [Selaginella moellendorffii]|uniref:Pentacotripeptide-repeat region of PRORP domain-containing protein n=1 Tax=Selaginella moellendorffii TaxID=88036 RepID=D8SYK9_SELML|nr:hypothetical protein SELMODRAFT_128086 [Selaginella moellendorffii]
MPEWDLISCTTMLSAHAQNGQVDEAKGLFDRIPELDLVSWTAMLSAYADNAKIKEAYEVFETMQERSILSESPDAVSFVCVLLACIHSGKLYEGWAKFCSMVTDFALKPTPQHYCCVVEMLGRAGHLRHAEDLLAGMPYLPRASAWRSLLGACRTGRDVEGGSRATGQVIHLDPRSASSYVVLSSIVAEI